MTSAYTHPEFGCRFNGDGVGARLVHSLAAAAAICDALGLAA